MGEWSIYGSNGSQKATVKKLEYSGEFMGETYVTCDVYAPSPISFGVGDYLEYRDERFVIDYDATRKKQAKVNTYGRGFLYEGMRFLSYVGELKKCEFLDFVPNDNQEHYSQLPEFSFFAEDVSDLADRIKANLDRLYTGNKAWTVSVAQGFEGKTNIDVQVSKITCFDALKLAYDQFEAQFVIRGRVITIGTAGSTFETNYKYGKGNGLKTIERSVDESDALITRLRAYGNTTNMPANYYRNLNTMCYADFYEKLGPYADNGADLHFHPNGSKFANNWFTEKSGSDSGHYWVEVSLDRELWLTAIASTNAGNGSVGFSVVSTGMYGSNTQDMLIAFNSQLGNTGRLYFRKGVNYDNWGAGKESGSSIPASLYIDRLMLPNFLQPVSQGSSTLVTDPYIDSTNIATLGIREKSVYFDGSDPELPDIHPSLEGMTAHDIDPVHGSSSDYLDEIAADATEIGGGDITTDGQFVNMDEVPGFQVKVKDIGFDINSYLSTETATLSMKSGKCGGREFTIVKVEKAVGGGYLLTCQRTEDINLYFPYKDYPIEAGDKFVLTGIEMPEVYITAAANRLYSAAVEYLEKHSQPQYVYAIKMDDIWMQRQADGCESVGDSYYWNIKEGDVMQVQDNDLGIYEGTAQNPTPISEVIDRLTIREGYDPIPQIEVVLRKEKPQGTIGVLLNRVKQLEKINSEQLRTINRQSEYITLVLGDRINDIANQADHQQVTYFGTETPTLNNYPYTDWYNQSQHIDNREIHIGDMYYDKTNHRGYLFEKNGNTYVWTRITDEHTLEALEIASQEQDTIDGKRRVFITGAGNLPNPPYEVGDLWVNAVFPANSTSTDESQHRYFNDILKCIIEKADGGTASINDWSLASRYIGEQELDNVYAELAGDIDTIREQEDKKFDIWFAGYKPLPLIEVVTDTTGKHPATEGWLEETDEDTYVTSSDTNPVSGKTYYKQTTSSNAPASEWSDSDKSVHIQDLFYDTSREPASEGGRAYRWKSLEIDGDTEYRWMDVSDADTIAALEKIADVASDGILTGGAEKTRVLSEWNQAKYDYTNYTSLATSRNVSKTNYVTAFTTLVTFLNGGTAPSPITNIPSWLTNLNTSTDIIGSVTIGGITYTNAEAYRQAWSYYYQELGNLLDALNIKADQNTAYKSSVFITDEDELPDPPYSVGDMWTDACYSVGNYNYSHDLLKCVTEKASGQTADITDWALATDYTNDDAFWDFYNNTYSLFVISIQGQVDKKAETWRQPTDPSDAQGWVDSEHVGDLWMDTSLNGGKKTYIYQNTGSSASPNYEWVAQDVPDEVFDEIDGKAEIFVQKPTTYNEKDMWIIESGLSSSDMPTGCQSGDIVVSSAKRVSSYNKADWTKKDRYTNDDTVNAIISNYGSILGITPTAQNVGEALGFLRQVLQGSYSQDGGLILASMIALKNGNDVMSGMNGTIGQSGLATPAAWYGGAMVDYETLTDQQKQAGWNTNHWARSLFRFDGTGYLAGGKISWNNDGSGFVAGGNLSWDANGNIGAILDLGGIYLKTFNNSANPRLHLMTEHHASSSDAAWLVELIESSGQNYPQTMYIGKSGSNHAYQMSIDALGNVLSQGELSAASDIRLKNVLGEVEVSVEQLAGLPIFKFTWKNGDKKGHVGTSAQEVEKILPELVTDDGTLHLNYSTLGTIAGIINSREVVELRKRVDLLEERLKRLEEKL